MDFCLFDGANALISTLFSKYAEATGGKSVGLPNPTGSNKLPNKEVAVEIELPTSSKARE